jgi:hypothetical protein
LTKIELPHNILSLKQQAQRTERILKAIREKKQITYRGTTIKITTDFSMETLKARRAWSEVFWALNATLGYSTQQTIIQSRWSNERLP